MRDSGDRYLRWACHDYKGGLRRNGGLHVHSSLLNVVLHD
ncbi:MAG: hypothetical protein OJF51_000396 [Nitrospira sp.]|nr:MAG: hypothetical protein OJF51_000396 [Nitrospira sp.]